MRTNNFELIAVVGVTVALGASKPAALPLWLVLVAVYFMVKQTRLPASQLRPWLDRATAKITPTLAPPTPTPAPAPAPAKTGTSSSQLSFLDAMLTVQDRIVECPLIQLHGGSAVDRQLICRAVANFFVIDRGCQIAVLSARPVYRAWGSLPLAGLSVELPMFRPLQAALAAALQDLKRQAAQAVGGVPTPRLLVLEEFDDVDDEETQALLRLYLATLTRLGPQAQAVAVWSSRLPYRPASTGAVLEVVSPVPRPRPHTAVLDIKLDGRHIVSTASSEFWLLARYEAPARYWWLIPGVDLQVLTDDALLSQLLLSTHAPQKT